MANRKTGIDFYRIDTDRYQDRRIKRLKKAYQCNGLAVYDFLLCEIYRDKGTYLEWDDDILFDVAEYFGLDEEFVREIVGYCVEIGLFDKSKMEAGFLTSASIQRRYSDICNRSKRVGICIPSEVRIPDQTSEECGETPDECDQSSEECDQTSEECGKTSEESTQNKININKNKREREARAYARELAPSLEDVSKYFLEIGGDVTMAARYYDYYTANGWTVGKNTMRDWRAAARTWKSREPNFGRSSPPAQQAQEKLLTYDEMLRMMERNGWRQDRFEGIKVPGTDKLMWKIKQQFSKIN